VGSSGHAFQPMAATLRCALSLFAAAMISIQWEVVDMCGYSMKIKISNIDIYT